MRQKFEDWLDKNDALLKIIFLWIIPAIVGVVLATIAFLEKGFLGSLAGLIRGVLFTYLAYLPIFLIYMYLSESEENRESVVGMIIFFVVMSAIGFIFWFITNY